MPQLPKSDTTARKHLGESTPTVPPKTPLQNSEGLVQIYPDTPPLGPGKGGLSTSSKDSATQWCQCNSEMILLAAKLRFDKRICRARGGFHGRCDVGSLGGLTSHKYIPNTCSKTLPLHSAAVLLEGTQPAPPPVALGSWGWKMPKLEIQGRPWAGNALQRRPWVGEAWDAWFNDTRTSSNICMPTSIFTILYPKGLWRLDRAFLSLWDNWRVSTKSECCAVLGGADWWRFKTGL